MQSEWLPRALEESRARGFLGPGAIGPQITHAEGFAQCWEMDHPTPPISFLDLGSGGGLPGLVLLDRWRTRAVFTDSIAKRVVFLREILGQAGVTQSAEVVAGRVEEIARLDGMTEAFDLVTSRSFGSPSVTAECGSRFLRIGGVMIVSEPPDDAQSDRWDSAALLTLGLVSAGRVRRGAAFQILRKISATPLEYPRAIGIPKKRPLY